jgi:prepilin-type processing-associated H-X9-DG protein
MDASVGDGGKYQGFPFSSTFWWATKMNQLQTPGPSDSWVFTDEHPDSIDDCALYVNPGYSNGTGQFTELSGSQHGGDCGMTFADGHAVIHHWVGRAVSPITYTRVILVNVVNDPDLAWLAQHTPSKQ